MGAQPRQKVQLCEAAANGNTAQLELLVEVIGVAWQRSLRILCTEFTEDNCPSDFSCIVLHQSIIINDSSISAWEAIRETQISREVLQ